MMTTWAVILAGGDGKRLAPSTQDDRGAVVPKQYCCLTSGGALWVDAVRRARYVAPRERTCMIVAEQHQRYWADGSTLSSVELAALYEGLPCVDFSRDVLQVTESALRVFTVPACGWADLGTPIASAMFCAT